MKSLYDTDVLLWSEEQAVALRALTEAESVPAADWERVATSIGNVGRSALAHVENGLRTMLVQAIAGYCDSDSLLRHERNRRTHCGQTEAECDISATIRARLDLDRLWREAFDQAMTEIPRRVLGVPPGIPRTCPFTLDELLADDFTYDRAVERLYILLTSWRPKADRDVQT
jgi:Domain of unknown function DUF29